MREGSTRDEWQTAYTNTHGNVVDMLTKPLTSGEKNWKFVCMLLHHLAPIVLKTNGLWVDFYVNTEGQVGTVQGGARA